MYSVVIVPFCLLVKKTVARLWGGRLREADGHLCYGAIEHKRSVAVECFCICILEERIDIRTYTNLPHILSVHAVLPPPPPSGTIPAGAYVC